MCQHFVSSYQDWLEEEGSKVGSGEMRKRSMLRLSLLTYSSLSLPISLPPPPPPLIPSSSSPSNSLALRHNFAAPPSFQHPRRPDQESLIPSLHASVSAQSLSSAESLLKSFNGERAYKTAPSSPIPGYREKSVILCMSFPSLPLISFPPLFQ